MDGVSDNSLHSRCRRLSLGMGSAKGPSRAVSISLFLSYDLPLADAVPGKLTVGGGVRHVGKTAGDTANSFFVSGYTLVDAFARYESTSTHSC